MYSLEQVEKAFGRPLQAWQKDFIENKSEVVVIKTGRKTGKTLSCSVKIVLDSLNEDFSFTDGILILSKGQRQASNVFDTVKGLFSRLGIRFSVYADAMEGQAYASKTKIILNNGNKILCLPAGNTGDTLRTYSFWKIYYDEAAYIPEDVFVATDPCLAVYGKQAIYASTPMLSSGKFFDEWHRAGNKKYEMMTADAGLVKPSWLAKKRLSMTAIAFQREYEGRFVEQAEGLFPSTLLAACTMKDGIADKKSFFGYKTFIGVDFARFGESDNVLAFCHVRDGIGYVWIEIVRGKMRTTHVTGRIMYLVNQYPTIRKIITDDHGVGAGPTDALIEALGNRRVIGISNQRRSAEVEGIRHRFMKADLYSNLIRLMEYGKIRILADSNQGNLIRSLRSMWYDYTSQGDLLVKGGYSHGAEALVRAVFPLVSGLRRISFSHINAIPYSEGGGLHIQGLARPNKVYGLEGESGWKVVDDA